MDNLQCNQIHTKNNDETKAENMCATVSKGDQFVKKSVLCKKVKSMFDNSIRVIAQQPGLLKLFNMLNLYCDVDSFHEQIQFYNKIKMLIFFYSQANFTFNYGEFLPYLPILEKLFLKTEFVIENFIVIKLFIHLKINFTLEVTKTDNKIFVSHKEIGGVFPANQADDPEASDLENFIIDQFEDFVTITFTEDELKDIPVVSVLFVSKFLESFFKEKICK